MTRLSKALTQQTFTPENTRAVLATVCRDVGLDPGGAYLMRHQTAAVYCLRRHPIVVKIARPETSLVEVERTLALTAWLATTAIPSITTADVPQPVTHAGCHTVFWRYLAQPANRRITAAHLGALLRKLHQTPEPPVVMPRLDAVAAIRRSLRSSRILSDTDRAFLTTYAEALFERLPHLECSLPSGLIHGDPQHRNALWDDQTPVLADWDSAAAGAREWDLITVEVHCRRFGYAETEYTAFADAYGYDVRDWDGYGLMRDVRELRMITTNARKSPPGSPTAHEVHRRIQALKNQKPDTTWSII
ncbi:MAG: phosphotransferase enzyme family protein [Stackebrandtia sp.]